MTLDRRTFINLVIGSITTSVVCPNIIPTALPNPNPVSNLGKELIRPALWLEGLHKVKIIGCWLQESRLYENSQNIIFEFESLDGKNRLRKYYSDRAAGFMIPLIKKCGIELKEFEPLELDKCINQIIEVNVKIRLFQNRQVNEVEA